MFFSGLCLEKYWNGCFLLDASNRLDISLINVTFLAHSLLAMTLWASPRLTHEFRRFGTLILYFNCLYIGIAFIVCWPCSISENRKYCLTSLSSAINEGDPVFSFLLYNRSVYAYYPAFASLIASITNALLKHSDNST